LTNLIDLPTQVGAALGSDATTGGLILSVAILASVGLALGATRINIIGTIMVLLATAGVLTAIGWLGAWFLIVSVILIAALFGTKLASAVKG
jgi:hypothetical protein